MPWEGTYSILLVMEYPTRNGIPVHPDELRLPHAKGKENNHHFCFTSTKFSRTATLLALRDLERLQAHLSVKTHKYLHDHYEPPELPSEEQAAIEILQAYEMGEQFKIYDRYARRYNLIDIPRDLADGLVATHSLRRIFDMAAD